MRKIIIWAAAITVIVVLTLFIAVWILLIPPTPEPSAQDMAVLETVFGPGPNMDLPLREGHVATSLYLDMRDGVRIAVDLLLPGDLAEGERVPAIIAPTRYWRRWKLAGPLDRLAGPDAFSTMLLAYGYAVVKVDARGTGASYGHRDHPWSEAELEDYWEIMDWAASAPWCDGRLGVWGISYGGTCAEFLARSGHPALKGALICFALQDVYRDIALPGGVFNFGFVSRWGRFNAELDRGEVPSVVPWYVRAVLSGPAGVEGEASGERLQSALHQHARNLDIYRAARSLRYRDEPNRFTGASLNDFSPHLRNGFGEVRVYAWSGWMDGAYARGLLARRDREPHRGVIGPWNHGGTHHVDPFLESGADTEPSIKVQRLEQVRFFEYAVKGRTPVMDTRLRYFSMGGGWRDTDPWPPQPQEDAVLYLASGEALSETLPSEDGRAVFEVDFASGSGQENRWRTQLGRFDVRYPDMAEAGRNLVFLGDPLTRPMDLAGSPDLKLRLALAERMHIQDGAVFAYLEAVGPDGAVRFLTDGLRRVRFPQANPGYLRGSERVPEPGIPFSLEMRLLPVAVRVPAGHRLRLVLAGADADWFARYPAEGPAEWELFLDGGCRLGLPVVGPYN